MPITIHTVVDPYDEELFQLSIQFVRNGESQLELTISPEDTSSITATFPHGSYDSRPDNGEYRLEWNTKERWLKVSIAKYGCGNGGKMNLRMTLSETECEQWQYVIEEWIKLLHTDETKVTTFKLPTLVEERYLTHLQLVAQLPPLFATEKLESCSSIHNTHLSCGGVEKNCAVCLEFAEFQKRKQEQ